MLSRYRARAGGLAREGVRGRLRTPDIKQPRRPGLLSRDGVRDWDFRNRQLGRRQKPDFEAGAARTGNPDPFSMRTVDFPVKKSW